MDRELVLSKYKKTEDKLLISKMFDKIDYTEKTNKVSTTDFYNESERAILKNVLNTIGTKNYIFYGGCENADRNILVFYPEKMEELFIEKSFKYDTIVSVFRIIIPKENRLSFNHSVYLGGLIKLGIKREKIGDIIVFDDGADIIVKKEVDKFLYSNLQTLTRFSNTTISQISVNDIEVQQKRFNNFKIITSSLRLDNMVAELARTSRSRAGEILNQERVFVNYALEIKPTKLVKESDIITIRGKGKFVIDQVQQNSKGKYIVMIRQYI